MSGGKINFVWRVGGPAGEVVLKYAAPYVRSVGPQFQLSQSRLEVEARAMAATHAACARHVPALLLYDPDASVLVQELLTAGTPEQRRRRVKLVEALAASATRYRSITPHSAASTCSSTVTPTASTAVSTSTRGSTGGSPRAIHHEASISGVALGAELPFAAAGTQQTPSERPQTRVLPQRWAPLPPNLAADLADLLAGYLLRNSVYEMPYEEHRRAVALLANEEVVRANAAVVFTDPWDATCERNRVPEGLAREVDKLRSDPRVRQEVSRLLSLYRTSREALIHNDLTAGNIMVPDPTFDLDCGPGLDPEANPEPHGSSELPSHGSQSSSDNARVTCTRAVQVRVRSCASGSSTTHLIDWEFATYGPMAYDIGSLLGNLLLSYCATAGASGPMGPERAHPAPLDAVVPDADRTGQQHLIATADPAGVPVAASEEGLCGNGALLNCVAEVWEGLEARVVHWGRQLQERRQGQGTSLGNSGRGGPGKAAGAQETGDVDAFTQRLLEESLGYAGCVMARLTFGMHHYPAVEAITCERRRTASQRLALRLAGALLSPETRAARGWVPGRDQGQGRAPDAAVRGDCEGGNGLAGEVHRGWDGGGNEYLASRYVRRYVRRLVRDAEAWASEVMAEAG